VLVDQLLPQREGWDISILGTDIQGDALEKARRGIYSPWSFRLVEPTLQARYFQEQRAEYQLNARIRDMVTFRQGNLFKDAFPNAAAGLSNIDLILCRNVFIYFKWNAVSVVLDKFARTLRSGGYLMTGHAELNAQDRGQLQVRELLGSVVYQRLSDSSPAPKAAPENSQAQPPALHTTTVFHGVTVTSPTGRPASLPQAAQPIVSSTQMPAPRTSSTQPASDNKVTFDALANLLHEAQTQIRNGAYESAANKVEQLLRDEPQNYLALCLLAQAYANLGRHEEAAHRCREAIAMDSFAPLPYSLLAHIAEEKGDSEEAKELLKKVIYLAPSFAPAYLELGALYEKEGAVARAQKMRATALGLLQDMAPEAVVEPYGLTSQELIRQLR
jgi:chemotaxis protein methyltransferase CheR